jgi:hypothetical protein
VYIAGLSRSPRRLLLAVSTLIGAVVFTVSSGTTSSLVIFLAVALGLARSGFLFAAPAGGAVVRETILLGGGLLLARFTGGVSLIAMSAALWSFFLVQALFFMTPGCRAQAADSAVDSFDAAYGRAIALLDEGDL